MSTWVPSSRRGCVLLAAGLVTGFLGICALSAYLGIEAWRKLDRSTPAPGATEAFYFYAGLVAAVVIALCIYVAQDVGRTDPRSAYFIVLLLVGGIGLALFLLLHPTYYAQRFYGDRYSCGSWLAPSPYTTGFSISRFCVARLGASFRWACLVAAAGVLMPLAYTGWQLMPDGLRAWLRAMDEDSPEPTARG